MATAVLPASLQQPPPSPPPVAPWAVVVKLSLRGETFRISFPIEDFSWKAVEEKVEACYDEAHRPSQWALVYRDDEDDLVTVSTERELLEAFRVFAELKEQPNAANRNQKVHMHFHVVAKLSLKEQLAPVLQVVNDISEKMARIANDTRDSLRKSSYVERGRESLYHGAVHTRDALSSAGRGISQRVRKASTVVAGEISEIPRRLRSRSRVSSQDMQQNASPIMITEIEPPMDDEARESNMDVADLLAQARAEEEEAERRALEQYAQNVVPTVVETFQQDVPSPQERNSARAAAASDAEDEDEEVANGSDAETCSTASEDFHADWSVVHSPSPPRALSPFFEVEAEDEVEASFSRWEVQLRTIRDIMPQVDLAQCMEILDKHNGNLEAVLVELIDL